ncbi:hypothetical protein CIHG_06308 [Coccidioides immitis H538.4]|uniref:Uncharacterized protein n=1 Tax=Coccidioides immitis H538.4 TaxID=396776 RepID=A0A0J8ULS5_COCIT|nr:hypothetical protein CIHG_06308 [Coccidioides immitis H538.4]
MVLKVAISVMINGKLVGEGFTSEASCLRGSAGPPIWIPTARVLTEWCAVERVCKGVGDPGFGAARRQWRRYLRWWVTQRCLGDLRLQMTPNRGRLLFLGTSEYGGMVWYDCSVRGARARQPKSAFGGVVW